MSREIAGLASRGDSESEAHEVTPDTDTESQDQMQKHQSSSFKRPIPVMGNRGIETRNSKRGMTNKKEYGHHNTGIVSSTATGQSTRTIRALEVENVERAINRYGTLPKGARIGAYLESLRQSDGTPIVAVQNNTPATIPADVITQNNLMSPRNAIKVQPQMIRSNSSGGVTMANSASASLSKLQRHRTTTDGTMITFSSFRGSSNSPKRVMRPTLADLEFPPPPLDLPPPPEEFEVSNEDEIVPPKILEQTHVIVPNNNQVVAPNSDVENTEPSVEEASTRFGVSLRKREPSTDSCSSLGSPGDGIDNTTMKEKSENKLVSELGRNLNPNKNEKSDPVSQLVSELSQSINIPKSSDSHYKTPDNIRKTPSSTSLPPKPSSTILSTENTTSGAAANTIGFKAQLKKVETKRIIPVQKKEEQMAIIDFKSRLRKVDNTNDNTASSEEIKNDINKNNDEKLSNKSDEDDDKSNKNDLKKNGNNTLLKPSHQNNDNNTMKKTEIKIDLQHDEKKRESLEGNSIKIDGDDDKRKSTGSISSLKKLWEAKETAPQTDQISQLSPKMGIKNSSLNSKSAPDDDMINEDQQLAPVKKPAVPVKPQKLTIYATPIQPKNSNDIIITATTTTNTPTITTNSSSSNNSSSMITTTISSVSNLSSVTTINRDTILELIGLLESSLKTPVSTISQSQWLQLSDKLNILQTSCVHYAGKETMAPHQKFQFRELVTRVENQSRSLRSAGSKNIQDNEKLVTEVGQSLKQISNALHR